LEQCRCEGVSLPLIDGNEVAVDFSLLPEARQEVASEPVSQAAGLLVEEYKEILKSSRLDLERARPNLKAAEHLSAIEGQAQAASQEAADAHRDIDAVDIKLNEVRQQRSDAFRKCFKQIDESVDVIYRKLTSHASGNLLDTGSRSTYLEIADLEEPYNGGIHFTAMPPMKRFCDISLLSSGERALAALALLFAVQAYQKPPFIVLDEVDAHLDNNGVQALARFVAEGSCQTLMISLQDAMYSCGEALVGVSKDKRRETSVTFTMDITQFRIQATGSNLAPLGA
jgi:structural maintenance of chromosome 1